MNSNHLSGNHKKIEEKYRELVQNANSIILRMDVKGNITFFNEFAQNFFGYKEEEILRKNVIGTIVPLTDTSGQDLVESFRWPAVPEGTARMRIVPMAHHEQKHLDKLIKALEETGKELKIVKR